MNHENFEVGDRIRLVSALSSQEIPNGTSGIITYIQPIGDIEVLWDYGLGTTALQSTDTIEHV